MKLLIRKAAKKSRSNPKDFRSLLESSRIDWQQYANTLPSTVRDPIGFFLENFEEYPLNAPGWFDSDYYLSENPDVRQDGANPLIHFLLFGIGEGRKGCADTEVPACDFSSVTSEPSADAGLWAKRKVSLFNVVNLKARCLKEKGVSGSLAKVLEDAPVNWPEVCRDLSVTDQAEAICKLLQAPVGSMYSLKNYFDPRLYLAIYPDIANAGISPLEHFLVHGAREGRIGWLVPEDYVVEGGQVFDPSQPTLVVVSHDATATGAPVVALELIKRLSRKYNIITSCINGGELRDDFIENGFKHLDASSIYSSLIVPFMIDALHASHPIDCVLLSSVESLAFLEVAASLGFPTVSLLHEFAEYTRPAGRMSRALILSDIAIYPAKSLKESGMRELREKTGARREPNNILIYPQGYMGYKASRNNSKQRSLRSQLRLTDDALIVAGAGHVQPRKGVDWFLQTCHHLLKEMQSRNDPRAERLEFIWLGGGYHEDDTHVSVWLDTYIHQAGIGDRCHFPGAVDDVQKVFQEADIYLLTSRLDPFPNVAIDALNADCGIGLFDGASGTVDFLREHSARAIYAPYGDTRELARQLANHFDQLIVRDGCNSGICRERLSFDQYTLNIIDALGESRRRKNAINSVMNGSTLFRERFNSAFYQHKSEGGEEGMRHFLSSLYKGLLYAKPYPGSAIQAAVSNRAYIPGESFSEYVEYVMQKDVYDMPVEIIKGNSNITYAGRIALQFHVYYNDLIPEYCHYFETLVGHDVDLFVSHVNDLGEHERRMLQDCVSGRLVTDQVENIGRDVHPFHQQFVEHIQGHYDLVGHFHTKKSTDSADGIGDRWRRYLLGNLLGSLHATNEILEKFNDLTVGLVFAEDAHCIDEADNGRAIETLLEPLGYSRRPYYHTFPVGTMFWARVEALADLGRMAEDTFKIPEPVPYDGTVLHAFERIIPQLTQETGFNVKRVFTPYTYW